MKIVKSFHLPTGWTCVAQQMFLPIPVLFFMTGAETHGCWCLTNQPPHPLSTISLDILPLRRRARFSALLLFIHPSAWNMDGLHMRSSPWSACKDDDARKCWDLPNFLSCVEIKGLGKKCHRHAVHSQMQARKTLWDVKGVSRSTKSQLLEWLCCCVLHGDNFLHLPAGALILLLDRLLTAVGIEYLFYRRDTLQFHHHSIHHILVELSAHREASPTTQQAVA